VAAFAATFATLGPGCLGIFGAGHLGRALAGGLVQAGFPPSRLLVCHRGSPESRASLDAASLGPCVTGAEDLARRSAVLLVALRPQDAAALAAHRVREGSLVVSFMAGFPLARLPVRGAAIRRARVMPSAPFTIAQRSGIAGLFPADEPVVHELCEALGLAAIPVSREDTLHAFTALGVCLPIALTYWCSLGREVDDAALTALAAAHGLPDYGRILAWAHTARQRSLAGDGLTAFLAAAATRGGVTAAILEAIGAGSSLPDALEAGVRRSRGLGPGADPNRP
jgi:pyrroline-5-carboxylate reductase